MPIGLAPHEHESGRDALSQADSRGRAVADRVACLFTVALLAISLAGCNCIIRSSTGSKFRAQTPAASLISQTANKEKVTESNKFTESQPRTPIPLPAATLLSPQPEPSCEVETTGDNVDERQKLDYEQQCYHHAEIIARDRLQLLQDSIDKTINAIKGTPIALPQAPLLSPQPEPSCEFETAGSSNIDERQKLDYERQCYRHAEMIVRDRLQLLQRSVDATISAIKRRERGSP